MANNMKPLHEMRLYTDARSIALLAQVAPPFLSNKTYAAGEFCTYQNTLKKCRAPVYVAGAWTGTGNWDDATLAEVLEVVADQMGLLTTKTINKDALTFEYGWIDTSTGQVTTMDTYLAHSALFSYEDGDVLTFGPSTDGLMYGLFYYHADSSYSHTPQADFLIVPASGGTIPMLKGFGKARVLVCEVGTVLNNHTLSDLADVVIHQGTTKQLAPPGYINKNVIVFGDSATDRTYEESAKAEWVDEMLTHLSFPFFKEYAVWGATWLNHATTAESLAYAPSDTANNVLWNQYNRLKAEIADGTAEPPDAILLYAGPNDILNYADQLGTVEDAFSLSDITNMAVTEMTTTCRAIRYLCELIHADYPACRLILITPYMVPDSAATASFITVRSAIITCCEALGIDYIDATYRSGMTRNTRYYEDGSHPSVVGAQVLGGFLANEISSKLQF